MIGRHPDATHLSRALAYFSRSLFAMSDNLTIISLFSFGESSSIP